MQELDSTARDRLFEKLGPSDEAFPPYQPDPEPWWNELEFDDAGTKLEYQGEQWLAEELATSDPALAQYTADSLAGMQDPPDVNNRACALVYADPANRESAADQLKGIKGASHADHNLTILERSEQAPAVAVDR
jgi:hypothetical protein